MVGWAQSTRKLTTKLLPSSFRVPPFFFSFLSQLHLHVLKQADFADARYGLVDFDKVVADGRWYSMTSSRRAKLKPKAIHNNFQMTTAGKIRRFQRFGQWVLNSDLSCNKTKVRQLLERRK